MFTSKRCFICLSMVALTWSPAAFGDGSDSASEPSALESLVAAIVAIFVEDPESEMGVGGQSGDQQEVGPNIPFIG